MNRLCRSDRVAFTNRFTERNRLIIISFNIEITNGYMKKATQVNEWLSDII